MIYLTRSLKLLIACGLAVLAIGLLHSDWNTKLQPIQWSKSSLQRLTYQCPTNTFNISRFSTSHKLAPQIIFYRRHIKTIPSQQSRQSITKIDEILLPSKSATIINTTGISSDVIDLHGSTCLPPITLPATDSAPMGNADFTPFIFGVSTTLPRLYTSVPQFVKWLTKPSKYGNAKVRSSNGAHLVVLLHNTTDMENQEAKSMLLNTGISAVVRSSDLNMTMEERWCTLIPAIYKEVQTNNRLPKPTWMVLMDDDTFFIRPSALSHALHSSYPNAANTPLMVGAQTEIRKNRKSVIENLLGGAGVFISLPLASELLAPIKTNYLLPSGDTTTSLYEKCMIEDKELARQSGWGGDIFVSHCVRRHTRTQLAILPGLHQQAIFGDNSGFYESGIDLLSIHHWKSWHSLDPAKTSLVGDICGEDCILQRFQFGADVNDDATNSMIFTNGYSINEYTTGIDFDTGKTETTFDKFLGYSYEEMDHAVGELRDKVGKERKLQWMLLDAEARVEGVVQWYGWKDGNDNLRKIAELVWLYK